MFERRFKVLGKEKGPYWETLKILKRIHKDLETFLSDYKKYIYYQKKKLSLVKSFVKSYNKAKFAKLRKIIEDMQDLIRKTLNKLIKESKEEKNIIDILSEYIASQREEKETLTQIKDDFITLSEITYRLASILDKQVAWFKKYSHEGKGSFWQEHEHIRELIEAIEEEHNLLLENALTGYMGEKQLLEEIYTHIMPLKDRITIQKSKEGYLIVIPKYGKPYIFHREKDPTDFRRWLDYEGAWIKRIKVMVNRIKPNSSVLDLGCGKGCAVRQFLPSGCTYQPVDLYERSPDTIVCNFNRGELPPLKEYNYVIISGVLEYIIHDNTGWFIGSAAKYTKNILLSYCPTELHPDREKRTKEYGWANHYSEAELRKIFGQFDLRITLRKVMDADETGKNPFLQVIYHLTKE